MRSQMASSRLCGTRALRAAILAAAVMAVSAASTSPAAARQQAACGKAGYSYAGFASAVRAHGIRATVTALSEPFVSSGHVAAWVGVGGPGEGPNGTDAWLQVGVSAVHGVADTALYYEATRPGRSPRYTPLGDVRPGEAHEIAVLEVADAPGTWRIWVDGEARSAPIAIAGSSGRWRPIATAETWDGGRRVCNRFDFAFGRVQLAASPGGSWRGFVDGQRFEDPGYRVVARSASSFRAAVA